MGLPVHTIDVLPGGDQLAQPDRLSFVLNLAIANAAGGSAGAAVTTAVSGMQLPANYTVLVQPNQAATAHVTSKTQSGFNVVLTPNPATATLAAGSFDVVILA